VEGASPPEGEETAAMKPRFAVALLRFLAAYGSKHPAKFEDVRFQIIEAQVKAASPKIRKEAGRLLDTLIDGFRAWLGENQVIAVDPETGEEYGWEDVITIEEGVDPEEEQRLKDAIRSTTLIRESIFLFSGREVPRLQDIPPGGIWVSHLVTKHGRSIYRITVYTRHQESYDFAVHLNRTLGPKNVSDELNWKVLTSEPHPEHSLVEKLGGFWPEYGLWTDAFASVNTVKRSLRHLARQHGEEGRQRLCQTWPYLAWNGLAAYFDFWARTNRTLHIGKPTPSNVIVPVHDYQTHTRIISISNRLPFKGLMPMMTLLWTRFIAQVEEKYEVLRGLIKGGVLFSALLEVVGEADGLRLLREGLEEEPCEEEPAWLRPAVRDFLDKVSRVGFRPFRLHFAMKRYRRWAALNPEAEPQARARTLRELYEVYGLERLASQHPEARLRFFRDTVFQNARQPLAYGIDGLIERMRDDPLHSDELIARISSLRAGPDIEADEDYFLTRLSYPHLQPEDAADFISSIGTGRAETDIVVTLEDERGETFFVRRAMNPKEVGRLLKLFHAAKLDVSFGPEDHYLVAVGERANLIGGIYYEIRDDGESAHLKKIVVSERFRKAGVSDGLMTEFFNRMRAAAVKTVTTGFFRPEYFYGYGFRIERRYAGLVKVL